MMRIQTIIDSLPSGLWKDNLTVLKKETEGVSLSKAERKWLENEIHSVQKSGKRGKLVNLIVLGLAIDREVWSMWIRKSSVLRVSKYDFNPVAPRFPLAVSVRFLPLHRRTT